MANVNTRTELGALRSGLVSEFAAISEPFVLWYSFNYMGRYYHPRLFETEQVMPTRVSSRVQRSSSVIYRQRYDVEYLFYPILSIDLVQRTSYVWMTVIPPSTRWSLRRRYGEGYRCTNISYFMQYYSMNDSTDASSFYRSSRPEGRRDSETSDTHSYRAAMYYRHSFVIYSR